MSKPSLPSLAAYFTSENSSQLIASVRAAERAGYGRAWLNDAHTLWQDVYVHMTRVLDATERITVGSGVTNLVTRHFSVAPSAHGTLAGIHPGRVVMGLGRGDAAVYAMGLAPMGSKEFGRQARLVRALVKGESVRAVEDKEFRIRWLGEQPIPIMIGATGPRNLRLAGAVADIVQMEVGVTEAGVRWGLEQVFSGAEAAGRDPSEIDISIVCAMWVSDDINEARARCRWAATSASNLIEQVARRPGHGMPEEMTNIVERRRASSYHHDYDKHMEASEVEDAFLTDELIDSFGIAGDAIRCRERLQMLHSLGVNEVASGFLNNELDQMQLVGESVIGA